MHQFVLLICGDNSYVQLMCKVVILSVVCGVGTTIPHINRAHRSERVNSADHRFFHMANILTLALVVGAAALGVSHDHRKPVQ